MDPIFFSAKMFTHTSIVRHTMQSLEKLALNTSNTPMPSKIMKMWDLIQVLLEFFFKLLLLRYLNKVLLNIEKFGPWVLCN